MSENLKVNLTRIALLCTIVACIGGAVWATAQRDADLTNIQDRMTRTEVKTQEHDKELSGISGDIKAMKQLLERIERKLP